MAYQQGFIKMIKQLSLFLALFSFLISATTIKAENGPLQYGLTLSLHSKVLNEKRNLLIYLPQGYESSKEKRYPVLYTLDGTTHFKHVVGTVEWLSKSANVIPGHIVVAIENTNRFRDFSPSSPKSIPKETKTGGADKFIEFLSGELIPFIEEKYRTQKFRTLVGHSFGGLLTLQVLLTRPELFQAYIAMSPIVIFDDMELVNRAKRTLNARTSISATLFMTLGNEKRIRPAFDKLVEVLTKQAPSNLKWQSHIYPEETHMSTPSKTLHNALLDIHNGWRVSDQTLEQGVEAVFAHYQLLSKRYGEKIDVPGNVINDVGYILLEKKKVNQAIAAFKKNVKLFPNNFNSYDSLAEAYEIAGKLKLALSTQEKAVQMAKDQKARNLKQVEKRLQEIKDKISTK